MSFPTAREVAIAIVTQNARAEIRSKRFGREHNLAKWFREEDLDTVKAALAAEIARTDALLVAYTETQPIPKSEPECQLDGPVLSEVGRERQPKTPECKPAPSAAARALADFHSWRTSKTGRYGRVIDRRPEGVVDLGDPPPGRSALDQRGPQ